MKKLEEVLNGVVARQVKGSQDVEVTSLHFDSRMAEAGTLFAAIRGTVADGHNYIDQAIVQGANVILCEHLPSRLYNRVTYVVVEDSALALGFGE